MSSAITIPEEAKAKSRLTGWVTLISAVFVLTAMLYATWRLGTLTDRITTNQKVIDTQVLQIKTLEANVNKTEGYLLDFLGDVTNENQVRLVDTSVNWPSVEKYIIAMPAGQRKRSLMVALLYAWKDVPFTLGGHSPAIGLDSPGFLQMVLAQTGVTFEKHPGEFPSAAMMRQLQKVDSPKAGDIAFYRGQVGSFGLLILDPGSDGRAPVGIGTLQVAFPLEVMSLDNVNTDAYPLIGYFHVKYPDE